MYRVILADDEPLILAGLCKKIQWEQLGFSICAQCEDGARLLEAVREHKPDLLIMDIRMPRMTGIEVMQAIPAAEKPLVIVISGYSDFAYAKAALQYGAVDYLLKPVIADALHQTVLMAKERLDTQSAQGALPGGPLPPPSIGESTSKQIIEKICAAIEREFALPLTLKQMAEQHHIDMSYLSTLFHAKVGKTFTAYLTEVRLARACQLLETTTLSHEKIAALCGYSQYTYFKRVFKKVLGVTPSQYREGHR